MPAKTHSTGPTAVIGVPMSITVDGSVSVNSGGWMMLGWCERSPEIMTECAAAPLFNTLGGVELPYEYYPQGATATISCTFTRWNEPNLLMLEKTMVRETPVFMYSAPTQHAFGFIVGLIHMVSYYVGGTRIAELFFNCRLNGVFRNAMMTSGNSVTVVFQANPVHVKHRGYWSSPIVGNTGIPVISAILGSSSIFGEMALGAASMNGSEPAFAGVTGGSVIAPAVSSLTNIYGL